MQRHDRRYTPERFNQHKKNTKDAASHKETDHEGIAPRELLGSMKRKGQQHAADGPNESERAEEVDSREFRSRALRRQRGRERDLDFERYEDEGEGKDRDLGEDDQQEAVCTARCVMRKRDPATHLEEKRRAPTKKSMNESRHSGLR
jgi:hypothetical protein